LRLRHQRTFPGNKTLDTYAAEAKALIKRSAWSAVVVVLVLLVFRALVPWVLVALVAYWLWKAASK
jgi:hypothetical protein